jgi:hypothetical protein
MNLFELNWTFEPIGFGFVVLCHWFEVIGIDSKCFKVSCIDSNWFEVELIWLELFLSFWILLNLNWYECGLVVRCDAIRNAWVDVPKRRAQPSPVVELVLFSFVGLSCFRFVLVGLGWTRVKRQLNLSRTNCYYCCRDEEPRPEPQCCC